MASRTLAMPLAHRFATCGAAASRRSCLEFQNRGNCNDVDKHHPTRNGRQPRGWSKRGHPGFVRQFRQQRTRAIGPEDLRHDRRRILDLASRADRLEQQGHKAYPLTLTGLGDRSHLMSKDINLDTHIADIVNLLEWEDLKGICLVAHSWSGYPASGALERIGDRVSSLVMLDALKPENGDKVIDLFPNLKVTEGMISVPSPKTSPQPDPKDAEWMVAKMTPQPIGPWLQPIKLTGAREKVAKKTYIRLPKYPAAALDKAYAECKADKSWTTIENTTSGHAAMVQEPEWLTGVLMQAA